MKKFLNFKLFLVSFSLLLLSSPASALAASSSHLNPILNSNVSTGNDISWPQCNKAFPKSQLFGIVGVNNGLANNTNVCFGAELAWANKSVGGTGQDKAALYVNTANPGNLGVSDWPSNNIDPFTGITDANSYGSCSGGDNQACAYQYGWNMAEADAKSRIGYNNPGNYKWWLDVETDSSWESNTANNTAVLEGMTAYFSSINARVGLYSTAYQWKQIAGSVSPLSNLHGLDSWLAGNNGLSGSLAACKSVGLTGGKTTVTQYIFKQIDYDYSCV